MAEYVSERLSEAFKELSDRAGNASLQNAFENVWPDFTGYDNQLHIISLLGDVNREVQLSQASKRSKERAVKKSQQLRWEFQAAICRATDWNTFSNYFDCLDAVSKLDDITDILETARFPRSETLVRDRMKAETEDLLDFFEKSELPQPIKQFARIQLESVCMLMQETRVISDTRLTEIINATVANVVVQLNELPGQSKGKAKAVEKVISWGKTTTHATAFALGLLVDGTAAVELLSGPDSQKQLPPPAVQIEFDEGDDDA